MPETIENEDRRRMTVVPNQVTQIVKTMSFPGIYNRHNSIRPVLVDAEMQTDGEQLKQVQDIEV